MTAPKTIHDLFTPGDGFDFLSETGLSFYNSELLVPMLGCPEGTIFDNLSVDFSTMEVAGWSESGEKLVSENLFDVVRRLPTTPENL